MAKKKQKNRSAVSEESTQATIKPQEFIGSVPKQELRTPNESYMATLSLWKKARWQATGKYKVLALFFVFIFALSAVDLRLLNLFEQPIALFFGLSTAEVSDVDPTEVLYASGFSSDEERIAAGEAMSYQLEAEGAVLLKNEAEILPLATPCSLTLHVISEGGLCLSAYETEASSAHEELLAEALENAGFVLDNNDEGSVAGDSGETGDINDSGISAAGAGVAVAVISRAGSESEDYAAVNAAAGDTDSSDTKTAGSSGGDLALTADEQSSLLELKALKDAGSIDAIILLINSANGLQLDFLDDEAYGIDAALQIGLPGSSNALQAVADILSGAINPSGRLADTLLKDIAQAPATANLEPISYAGDTADSLSTFASTYLVYQEGIYVGYRYFETRYEDYVCGRANTGDFAYDVCVSRPFGFGLSYTSFAYSNFTVSPDEAQDSLRVSLTVSNIGSVSGKHTVLLFAQSPYTAYDREVSLEKSSVMLVGFAKTAELAPGESADVLIEVDKADLASFDAYGAGSYILEAGDYYLTVASDAHAAINNILAAKGYTTTNSSGRMDAAGDSACVWSWTETVLDTESYATAASGAAIVALFSDADPNVSSYVGEQSVVWLSRSDWEGTYPKEAAELSLTEAMADELELERYDAASYTGSFAGAHMPLLSAESQVSFFDLIGAVNSASASGESADASAVDTVADALLDQMSVEELAELLGAAFYGTSGVTSVSLPPTSFRGGSFGIEAALFERHFDTATMSLPSQEVLAATYNVELIERAGELEGEDALAAGVSGLYGPGGRIHRSSCGGNNAEGYSEDPYLAAQMLLAQATGIESKGCVVLASGFLLDTQSNGRLGLGVWANEQTIREIYLQPYRSALESDAVSGIMLSYNRIGTHYVGADIALITGLLREEWGFSGIVSAPNTGLNYSYINGVDMVLAGSDISQAMVGLEKDQLLNYEADPVVVSAMRAGAKRVLLTLAGSNAANEVGASTTVKIVQPFYMLVAQIFMLCAGSAVIVCIVVAFNKSKEFKQESRRPSLLDFV